jgi:hypothetical protein
MSYRPELVISGGQTGADAGALVGAKQLGIKTGGWMPYNCMTENGPLPAMLELYGMKEHPNPGYPARTKQNARWADVTIWVGDPDADLKDDRGFRCTEKACFNYGKPFLENPTPEELREFCERNDVKVLNVAGPRASKDKLAHRRAAELIKEAFNEVPEG